MKCFWRGRHPFDDGRDHGSPKYLDLACPTCHQVVRCGVITHASGTYLLRVPEHSLATTPSSMLQFK